MIDGTFGTLRRNPTATLGMAAIVAALTAVPSIALTIAMSRLVPAVHDQNGTTVNFGSQLALYPASLITALGSSVLTGMLMVVLSEAVLGRQTTIGAAWQRIRPRILPLLGLVALYTVLPLLVIAVIVGIVLALVTAGLTAVAIIVGVLLGLSCVIGLIYLIFRASLASAALVLERMGPITAIRRSFALTKVGFWRVAGILLLANVCAAVAASTLTTPVTFGVILTSLPTAPTHSFGLSLTSVLSLQIATLVATVFTAPFVACMTGLVYLDQRIRTERLDVTLIAASARTEPKVSGDN